MEYYLATTRKDPLLRARTQMNLQMIMLNAKATPEGCVLHGSICDRDQSAHQVPRPCPAVPTEATRHHAKLALTQRAPGLSLLAGHRDRGGAGSPLPQSTRPRPAVGLVAGSWSPVGHNPQPVPGPPAHTAA